MFKKTFPFLFIGLIMMMALVIFNHDSAAQTLSPDVIAVRVVPNPNHYSPSRWYQEEDFQGAPQKLIVDGYEAVRDGRTVYVDVGNVDFKTNKFYTNIYIISYNQEAEQETIDILGQLISFWKFNTNVTELGVLGSCLDPAANSQPTGQKCFLDADCPAGSYCDSLKSDIIRDTKRLADLADLKLYLSDYRQIYGHYPILASGTYIPNKTISVWPSWQKTFALELGKPSLPDDPINYLGSCQACCADTCAGVDICQSQYKFNSITCWDEVNKRFADPKPEDNMLNLPAGSNVFMYEVSPDGYSYNVCSVMESGYLTTLEEGACGDSVSLQEYELPNRSPIISCSVLTGYPNTQFSGFISIYDLDASDEIASYEVVPYAGDWSSWSELKIAQDTLNKRKFIISADQTGEAGNYDYYVQATDSRGESYSQRCRIKIVSSAPIIYPIPDQTVFVGDPLEFVVRASESGKKYPLEFIFSNSLISAAAAPRCNGIQTGVSSEGDYYLCHVDIPSVSYPVGAYDIKVRATDTEGEYAEDNFTLTVTSGQPIMSQLECLDKVRWGTPYACTGIPATTVSGRSITAYYDRGLPNSFDLTTTNIDPKTGTIFGQASLAEVGDYSVEVWAEDSTGAVSSPVGYSLHIVSYCGDGTRQYPNTEGRGGPSDNGYEDCDDGNTINTDSCSNNCTAFETPSNCGNGFLDSSETCDYSSSNPDAPCNDGDDLNDYCSEDCSCSECGDTIIEGGEECEFRLSSSETVSECVNRSSSYYWLVHTLFSGSTASLPTLYSCNKNVKVLWNGILVCCLSPGSVSSCSYGGYVYTPSGRTYCSNFSGYSECVYNAVCREAPGGSGLVPISGSCSEYDGGECNPETCQCEYNEEPEDSCGDGIFESSKERCDYSASNPDAPCEDGDDRRDQCLEDCSCAECGDRQQEGDEECEFDVYPTTPWPGRCSDNKECSPETCLCEDPEYQCGNGEVEEENDEQCECPDGSEDCSVSAGGDCGDFGETGWRCVNCQCEQEEVYCTWDVSKFDNCKIQ